MMDPIQVRPEWPETKARGPDCGEATREEAPQTRAIGDKREKSERPESTYDATDIARPRGKGRRRGGFLIGGLDDVG